MKHKVLLVVTILAGLMIAFVDSRPGWDDTGITVLAFLVCSGIVRLLIEKRPWLYALTLGLWLQGWYIFSTGDPSMLIVLAFPFIGVYLGRVFQHGYRKVRGSGGRRRPQGYKKPPRQVRRGGKPVFWTIQSNQYSLPGKGFHWQVTDRQFQEEGRQEPCHARDGRQQVQTCQQRSRRLVLILIMPFTPWQHSVVP